MRPDGPRDPTAGPDSGPEPPFPLRLNGKVVKGFGRGSSEVGETFQERCCERVVRHRRGFDAEIAQCPGRDSPVQK